MSLILIYTIPVILVWGSICFSFNLELTLKQKACCFIILPVVEAVVSIIAIIEARSIEVNLIDNWQIYLLYFLFGFGLISTLVVTLLEELNSTAKLSIRITALTMFGFIFAWMFLGIK